MGYFLALLEWVYHVRLVLRKLIPLGAAAILLVLPASGDVKFYKRLTEIAFHLGEGEVDEGGSGYLS